MSFIFSSFIAIIFILNIDHNNAQCVLNALSLNDRLAIANPGDVIDFCGEESIITTFRSGTPTHPITVRGIGPNAIIRGTLTSGYCVSVGHDWYIFEDFTAENCKKGVVVTRASHGYLRRIIVQNIYEEGFKFRDNSQYWLVDSSIARNCGLRGIYGEGFYVGQANSNWINGIPDGSAFITFINCISADNANDGYNMKEGI